MFRENKKITCNVFTHFWGKKSLFFESRALEETLTRLADFSLPVALMLGMQIALGFMQRTIPQLQIFIGSLIFTSVIYFFATRVPLHFGASSEVHIERFTQQSWFIISHLRNG